MPNFHRYRSLGNIPLHWVLVVPFVLLTTGAVSLVGYLSYWSGQQAVEELATDLITEVGDRIDHNLSNYLQTPTEINRMNAAAARIGTLDWQNFTTLKQYFWQQLTIFDVTSIAIITDKKQFLVIREQDNGSRLVLLSNESTNFTLETRLTDPQGKSIKLLAQVPNFNPHTDRSSNSSYNRTRKSGGLTWQIYAIVIDKQKPTLIAANYFPLYDRTNTFRGIFGASVSLTKVGKFLEGLDIGKNGEAFVIDRTGNIIGTSTGETPVSNATSPARRKNQIIASSPDAHRLSVLNSHNLLTRATAQSLIERFGQFDHIIKSHQLTIDIEGQRYFVQISPFSAEQNFDWLRVVLVPESDFMEQIEANNAKTILLSWLTLFSAMAIGILTARCISKPIHKLSQASQLLAQGDWQQALSENTAINTSISELKTLTNSFNQTAKILKNSFERIKIALQESEEKFTKVFKNSPDPIAITTLEGQYLDVNDSFLVLSEYSREEIIGRTKSELKLSIDINQDTELRNHLQEQGTVTNFEYRYQTKYGRVGTTLLSQEKIELDGQLCILTVAKDISERKQMELDLRNSEARFQKITSAVPGEIFILVMHPDGSFNFEYMSSGCREIQEVEPAQIIADPAFSFDQVHPDDRDMMYAIAAHSAKTLEPFHGEWRIITPSGQLKWVQVSSRPEQRENGDIVWYGLTQDVSLSKHTEEQLRKTEHWLQQFSRQSPSSIYTFVQEPDGHVWFEYVSSAIESIHELTVAAVLEDANLLLDTIHPEDRASYQAIVNESQQTLSPFCHQWRIVTPSGFIKWVQGNSQPVRRSNGAIAWHGVVQDITDRKQAEEALASSEARLRAILTAIPDIIVIYSNDGIYLDAMRTNSLHDLVNHSNPVGKHLNDLVPSDIAKIQLQAMQQVAKTQEPAIYEQEVWVRGKLQYEEVRIVACGDQSVLVIIRDISARKLHEIERQIAVEALRESEERFRRAFDDAAIGMAWLGIDGHFLKVSRSLCEIVGFAEEELLAGCYQDITHPDDIRFDEELSQRMLAGDQRVCQREKRYIHRQGHIIWVLVHVSLVRDREGNPLYFVSQVQDISDRHELDRIKDEFISIVSHELRTPLTAIRGSLGILETGVLDNEPETAKQMLQVALNNSERLVRLVNDILDLERLEAGDVDLVLEDYQVDDLLQQAVESVQTIALQSAITIQVTSLNTRVQVAPDAIVQAIVNLLGNAIKFSAPGSTIWLKAEIRNEEWRGESKEEERREEMSDNLEFGVRSQKSGVRSVESELRSLQSGGFTQTIDSPRHPSPSPSKAISTPPQPTAPSYILISIQDQGRGIPAEKLKSIFGRFQQVDVSDARQKGGTGLGLAICKSIVQQHGGKIWVDSVLDQGSTFYFTLPLSEQSC